MDNMAGGTIKEYSYSRGEWSNLDYMFDGGISVW